MLGANLTCFKLHCSAEPIRSSAATTFNSWLKHPLILTKKQFRLEPQFLVECILSHVTHWHRQNVPSLLFGSIQRGKNVWDGFVFTTRVQKHSSNENMTVLNCQFNTSHNRRWFYLMQRLCSPAASLSCIPRASLSLLAAPQANICLHCC